MNEASVRDYIESTFTGLDIEEASGDTFYFVDPEHTLPPDRRIPFATVVTADNYEKVSNLDRPDVFRLNFGVKPQTYRSMFGAQPGWAADGAPAVETGHDFAALDEVTPHPVYAPMSWLCVLNPSDATFEAVKPLLAESYELAVRRHARRSTDDSSPDEEPDGTVEAQHETHR